MTPVETLREAARLMRGRAKAAPEPRSRRPLPPHVTSWTPAVALAVADWLDGSATRAENTSRARLEHDQEERDWLLPALAVACAYLSEAA